MYYFCRDMMDTFEDIYYLRTRGLSPMSYGKDSELRFTPVRELPVSE